MFRNCPKEVFNLTTINNRAFHTALASPKNFGQTVYSLNSSQPSRRRIITNFSSDNQKQRLDSRLYSSSIATEDRHLFGLRPPEKEPWKEDDERWDTDKLESLRPEPPVKHRGKGGKVQEKAIRQNSTPATSSPIGVNALKESSAIDLFNLSPRVELKDLYEICETYGKVVDISYSRDTRYSCQIEFQTVEEARRAKEQLQDMDDIFLEDRVVAFSRSSALKNASKFLEIQGFTGTIDEVSKELAFLPNINPQIIYAKNHLRNLRVDMVVKFQTVEDAIHGKRILTLAGFSTTTPRFIEPGRYFSLMKSPEEATDSSLNGNDTGNGDAAVKMAPYTTPSSGGATLDGQRLDEDEDVQVLNTKRFGSLGGLTRPSQRSRVIYLGQVPVELLRDSEDIRARFSRYGPLRDVRIPKTNLNGARSSIYLEYYRQEDADALFDDLQLNPLFLFGRRVAVDYDLEMLQPRHRMAETTVQFKGIDSALFEDPWTMWEALYEIAPPVDLRIAPLKNDRIVYVDFENVEDSARALKAFKSEAQRVKFGQEVTVQRRLLARNPADENLALKPSDTLRLWNLPARAILDKSLLRDAFRDCDGLLNIRIPQKHNFPRGLAFLQFGTVRHAREALDWIRSEPNNPITFYGRPLKAEFANSDPTE